MKKFSLVCFGILTLALSGVVARAADPGVAIAIVYDTSGSMGETVPDANKQQKQKYIIANRALIALVDKIDAYAKNKGGEPRNVQAGLFTFKGTTAEPVIEMAPFNAEPFKDWASRFKSPSGSTPLGNALKVAGEAVLKSPLSRKHVLIVTDGMNTAGPDPARTLPELKKTAAAKGSAVSTHFVAFDVDAKVFAGVKKLGSTVVSASDETQLNSQLDFILKEKILLEDEEPAK